MTPWTIAAGLLIVALVLLWWWLLVRRTAPLVTLEDHVRRLEDELDERETELAEARVELDFAKVRNERLTADLKAMHRRFYTLTDDGQCCPDPHGHDRLMSQREQTWRTRVNGRDFDVTGNCPWCGRMRDASRSR